MRVEYCLDVMFFEYSPYYDCCALTYGNVKVLKYSCVTFAGCVLFVFFCFMALLKSDGVYPLKKLRLLQCIQVSFPMFLVR